MFKALLHVCQGFRSLASTRTTGLISSTITSSTTAWRTGSLSSDRGPATRAKAPISRGSTRYLCARSSVITSAELALSNEICQLAGALTAYLPRQSLVSKRNGAKVTKRYDDGAALYQHQRLYAENAGHLDERGVRTRSPGSPVLTNLRAHRLARNPCC